MTKLIPLWILVFLVSSCHQPTIDRPLAGTSSSTGHSLTLTANTSALGISKAGAAAVSSVSKTILPGSVSFDTGAVTYTLTVTGSNVSFNSVLSNTSGTFGIASLADGTYSYTLTAVSSGVTIGFFSGTFTVAGQPVSLTPVLAIPAGTGKFSLSLSWPSSYGYTAVVTWTPLGGSASVLSVSSAAAQGLTTLTYPAADMPSGNYTLAVTLTQAGASVASWGLQESVFIYSGQTTAWSQALTSSDLNAPLASGAAPGVSWNQSLSDVVSGGVSSFYPVLSWASVTGATSYTLQYLNSSSVWTDVGPVSSPYNLSGENAACTKSYRVVAKNLFGSTAQPAVQVSFPTAWYAAPGGTGDGTAALTPTGDFQRAVDQAYVASLLQGGIQQTVRATLGTFVPDRWPGLPSAYQNASYQTSAWKHFTLRPNVKVEGGYTSDFSAVTGRTDFSGGGSLFHVFYVSGGVSNAELKNARILNGSATGSTYASASGGGLLIGSLPDGNLSSGSFGWNSGTLTLTNCLFTGNTCAYDGGGLSVTGGLTGSPTLNLMNCQFTSNSSTGSSSSGGGAVTVQGTSGYPVIFQASGAAVSAGSQDFYQNSSVVNAGALVLKYVQGTLLGLAVCSNTGGNGAGLFSQSSSIQLQSIFFDSNTGNGLGGGLSFLGPSVSYPSSLQMSGVSFSNNQGLVGGGAFLENAALSNTNHVTFSSNRSTGGNGGGLYVSGGTGSLNTVTFNLCAASGAGGAIYGIGSIPSLTAVTFSGNSASQGGSMYLSSAGSPAVSGSVFQSNLSNQGNFYGNGGAIYLENTNPAFTDCDFLSNTAYEGGGAVFINNISQPLVTTFTRCRFLGNTASLGGGTNPGGGAIREYGTLAGTTDVFLFCLFHDNTDALSFGHAIYAAGNPIALVKCTVGNNGGSLSAANQVVLHGSNPSLFAFSLVNSWVATTDPVGNFIGSLQTGLYNNDSTYTLTAGAQALGMDSFAGIACRNFLASSDLTAFSVFEYSADLTTGVGTEKFSFANPGWIDVSSNYLSSGIIPSPALNGTVITSSTLVDLGCNEQGN